MTPYNPHRYLKQSWYAELKEAVASVCVEVNDHNIDDEQILRIAIASEISAINLYKQLANNTDNEIVKKILLDIAGEEKVHIGEFEEILLNSIDTSADNLKKQNDGAQEASSKFVK